VEKRIEVIANIKYVYMQTGDVGGWFCEIHENLESGSGCAIITVDNFFRQFAGKRVRIIVESLEDE